MKDLIKIQQTLKVSKNRYNNFAKFKYRSCEDVLEALKPIAHPLGYAIFFFDEIVQFADRVYIKSTATLTNREITYNGVGFARESETKKGMDEMQITGTASSYARKRALEALLAIDDTKSIDAEQKAESPKTELTPTSEKWDQAVQFIKKGGTIDSITEKYSLSEEHTAALLKNEPE